MFIQLNEEEKTILEDKKDLTPLKEASNFRTQMEKDIVEDYRKGVGVTDITEKYNISMGLVYTVLNNHKVTKRRKNSGVALRVKHITGNPAKLEALIHDYQFMNVKDIYKKYSIHKNGLYYILDLYNVKRKWDMKDNILEGNKEDLIVE